jgi:hypothetical protein
MEEGFSFPLRPLYTRVRGPCDQFIGGLARPIARVDAVAMKKCLSMLGIEPVSPAGNKVQSEGSIEINSSTVSNVIFLTAFKRQIYIYIHTHTHIYIYIYIYIYKQIKVNNFMAKCIG